MQISLSSTLNKLQKAGSTGSELSLASFEELFKSAMSESEAMDTLQLRLLCWVREAFVRHMADAAAIASYFIPENTTENAFEWLKQIPIDSCSTLEAAKLKLAAGSLIGRGNEAQDQGEMLSWEDVIEVFGLQEAFEGCPDMSCCSVKLPQFAIKPVSKPVQKAPNQSGCSDTKQAKPKEGSEEVVLMI